MKVDLDQNTQLSGSWLSHKYPHKLEEKCLENVDLALLNLHNPSKYVCIVSDPRPDPTDWP